ncbi:hypothetical protein [uncultured Methanoregula sp.]|uniref:hypothetical protein n=1 Tax=uncultured Methanoregula sp. TaxID=1005933 RepID=UPI002AAAB860|nr:hypothetical protein [uncultured Methanoregula sp.]
MMKPYFPVLVIMLLFAAAALAGCTSSSRPDSLKQTAPLVHTTGKPETTATGSSGTWISTAPAGSPGAALLTGAKELLKSIYTYTPGSPDYLPESYTAQKRDQTDYVIHGKEKTRVLWPAAGKTRLLWESEPKGVPAGWTGTTIAAGPIETVKQTEPVMVMTDCSGLVTSLFTYANTIAPTKFTGWKAGSTIPQAGCFDPSEQCETPNPLNYYRFFVTGENGWFESVPLAGLQPGDIIAYANTKNRVDSGHIMLVAAVGEADASGSRDVVVIDETGDPHASDTRHETSAGHGIGMGIIRLSPLQDGTARFFWSTTTTIPQEGPAALGRAR